MNPAFDGTMQHIIDSGIFPEESVNAFAGQLATDALNNAYTSQLASDALKSKIKLPAALLICKEFSEKNCSEGHSFEVIIITESKTYDAKTKLFNNLDKAFSLIDWFSVNRSFEYDESAFLLNPKTSIKGKVIYQTERHTLTVIYLDIVPLRT